MDLAGGPCASLQTARRARDGRTNWAKADSIAAPELEASIRADVDDVQSDPDWTQAVMGIPFLKDHVNIRIDHDVLAWFKSNGQRLPDPYE